MVFGMIGECFKVFILLGCYATFDLCLFNGVSGESIVPNFKVQAVFFIMDSGVAGGGLGGSNPPEILTF
jgi:hypothetical protein